MSAADLMARIDTARGDRQRASDLLAEARGMGRKAEPQPPEGLLDKLGGISGIGHAVLDVAGFIPGVGIAADLLNAGLYAAEGDYAMAGLSAVAAVPLVGDAAAAIKLGAKGVDAAAGIAKNADNAVDAAKFVDRTEELYKQGEAIPISEKTLDQALNPEQFLYDVAEKHGINLRGTQIKYDESLGRGQGRYGRTIASEGGRVIRIGPDATANEIDAANTIAHELSHARDYLRGGPHKPHGESSSLADGSAYGSGNALEDYIRGNR